MPLKFTQEQYENKLRESDKHVICIGEYAGATTKILHKCLICSGEWDISPEILFKSKKCPYCANDKILVGFNDIWTTHPEIAKLLLNSEDGYKYVAGSHMKTDWKCLECGHVIRDREIRSVVQHGKISCSKCKEGISYPEKFIANMLSQLQCDFTPQKTFKWSKKNGDRLPKRYDFFIPSLNCIIEVHGGQHYTEGHYSSYIDSLEKIKKSDIFKFNTAIENGINEYIVIDANISDMTYIKESVLKSKLSLLFDLSSVDWDECHKNALKSKIIEVCDLWNSGLNLAEISKIIHICTDTVSIYLRRGAEAGICVYNRKESALRGMARSIRKLKRVQQFDFDGNFIAEFSSVREVSETFGIPCASVYSCCKGHDKNSHGYVWKYIENNAK